MQQTLTLFDFEDPSNILEIERTLEHFKNQILQLQPDASVQYKSCIVHRHRLYEVEISNLYHEVFQTVGELINFLEDVEVL